MGKPKKDIPDPEGVQDVMREEKSRGRRPGSPVDTDILRGRKRRLQDLRKLLRINRKEDFVEAIRDDLGLEPNSPLFEDAIHVWEKCRRF